MGRSKRSGAEPRIQLTARRLCYLALVSTARRRSATVFTNLSCSLNCRHCACEVREKRDLVAAAPRRIVAALEAGAEDLTLTGGEPLLRRDLERLVAFAKRSAGERPLKLSLDTHATDLTPARAEALAGAGVDMLRVEFPGWGPSYDRTVGVAGAFEATLAGLRAGLAAGLAFELVLPLLAELLDELPRVATALAERGLAPASILMRIPARAPVRAPWRELVSCVEACDQAARELELWARLDPGSLLPPCLFTRPAKISHLYTLTPGGRPLSGWRKLPACARCKVGDRCPGVPPFVLAEDPELELRPIEKDRVRRRLSLLEGVDEQIERELVSHELGRDASGATWPIHTVRINFLCNQACDFCFVSTHLPFPPEAKVRAAIRACAEAGAALALSGGEPTLNPRLPDYVRYARERGVDHLELQTNAIRLADPDLCAAVLDAGVSTTFVSLHGSQAEICDRITRAPGTWAKTVAGLDQLHAHGAHVRVNFVMCALNARDFLAVVELVATRWPGFIMNFSFVAPSTDNVPRTPELIPRYSDMAAPMLAGFRRARELGLTISGFESMCAIPLCLKPDGLDVYEELSAVEAGLDRGEFRKPEVCDGCSVRERCWGIRRGYAELHGTDELRPFS